MILKTKSVVEAIFKEKRKQSKIITPQRLEMKYVKSKKTWRWKKNVFGITYNGEGFRTENEAYSDFQSQKAKMPPSVQQWFDDQMFGCLKVH